MRPYSFYFLLCEATTKPQFRLLGIYVTLEGSSEAKGRLEREGALLSSYLGAVVWMIGIQEDMSVEAGAGWAYGTRRREFGVETGMTRRGQ